MYLPVSTDRKGGIGCMVGSILRIPEISLTAMPKIIASSPHSAPCIRSTLPVLIGSIASQDIASQGIASHHRQRQHLATSATTNLIVAAFLYISSVASMASESCAASIGKMESHPIPSASCLSQSEASGKRGHQRVSAPISMFTDQAPGRVAASQAPRPAPLFSFVV